MAGPVRARRDDVGHDRPRAVRHLRGRRSGVGALRERGGVAHGLLQVAHHRRDRGPADRPGRGARPGRAARGHVHRREHQHHRGPGGAAHRAAAAARRPLSVDGQDVMPEVHAVLARMGAFARRRCAAATWRATGEPIRDVVNIGIGGSDLGPGDGLRGAAALRHARPRTCASSPTSTARDLAERRCDLDPAETAVRRRVQDLHDAGDDDQRAHRAGLVAGRPRRGRGRSRQALRRRLDERREGRAFGIDPANMFGFWDWVGGRYSLGSAIGLPR